MNMSFPKFLSTVCALPQLAQTATEPQFPRSIRSSLWLPTSKFKALIGGTDFIGVKNIKKRVYPYLPCFGRFMVSAF